MARKLLVFLTFLLVLNNSLGQEQENEKILFSEALSLHLSKYENKAKTAYIFRDYERATFLFDSLVKYGLKGAYMDDFKFYRLNRKSVALNSFKKPVYFITYASWCITTRGEIPAFNELAEKYHDKIDFVILFWDDLKTSKRVAKSYNKNITVLYVDELKNKDAFVVKKLKHSLGLPTTFLLDKDKKILDIRRGVSHAYNIGIEESLDANYNSIFDGIANHLLSEQPKKDNPGSVAAN